SGERDPRWSRRSIRFDAGRELGAARGGWISAQQIGVLSISFFFGTAGGQASRIGYDAQGATLVLRQGMQVTPAICLRKPLRTGGMGTVWVADHAGLKTPVVVKFAFDPDVVGTNGANAERFAREAASAAKVKSAHVVQVFESGVTGSGLPYIV